MRQISKGYMRAELDLLVFIILFVRPELVSRDCQSDQVEQGGNPAVKGRLLVAIVQSCDHLIMTQQALTERTVSILCSDGSISVTLMTKISQLTVL